MNDATSTVITTTAGTTDVTSNYVQVDWNAYQPLNVYDYGQHYYPYQPWGGWYPWVNPWPYIPPPQIVTQQIVIPRGLTENEIDAIADRVAKKILAAKKKSRAI